MTTSKLYDLLPPGYELIEDDHILYLYGGTELLASFTIQIDPQSLHAAIEAIIESQGAR
jgi:hypothetical protein